MRKTIPLISLLMLLNSCAYFNTFYNAKTYFSDATKRMELEMAKDGNISRNTADIFENASQKAMKVIEKYPDSKYVDDAMYIAGVANFYLAKYTIARSMFSRLTIEYPLSSYYAESHLWIARCYYESGEKDIAFKMLETFISDPKNKAFYGDAMSLAGYLALDENQEEKAFEYFNQAVAMTNEIRNKSNILYEMSQIYIDRTMLDEALDVLEQIEDISIDPEMLTRVQLQYAKIFRIQKMYTESEDLIKEMLANENNKTVFPDLELELAQVYLQQDKPDQAIVRYQTVIDNYPNTIHAAKASFNLGELYLYSQGDYENARNAFVAVSQHHRNILESTLAQAKINQIGRYVSLSKELRDLESKHPTLLNKQLEPDSLLTLEITSNYLKKKFNKAEYLAFDFQNPDSALQIYQSLVNYFPENPFIPQILNTWSYVLAEKGDTIRSEMIKNRLIRDHPFSLFSLNHLGREHPDSIKNKENQELIFKIESEYFNQGRHYDGINALKSLLDSVSLDTLSRSQVLYRIGMEYDRELSNMDSAVFYYRQTVDLHEKTRFANKGKSRLQELNLIIEKLMEDPDPDSPEPASEGDITDD